MSLYEAVDEWGVKPCFGKSKASAVEGVDKLYEHGTKTAAPHGAVSGSKPCRMRSGSDCFFEEEM